MKKNQSPVEPFDDLARANPWRDDFVELGLRRIVGPPMPEPSEPPMPR